MCRVGEGDTDTMSDIYLAMMCIVECTSLVEMTQTLHLISVLSCLCIVVCAGLVKKYSQVMQRYYVQYSSCYDVYCYVCRFGEEVQPGDAEVLCPVSV